MLGTHSPTILVILPQPYRLLIIVAFEMGAFFVMCTNRRAKGRVWYLTWSWRTMAALTCQSLHLWLRTHWTGMSDHYIHLSSAHDATINLDLLNLPNPSFLQYLSDSKSTRMRALFPLLGFLTMIGAITASSPEPDALGDLCTGVAKARSIVTSATPTKEKWAIDFLTTTAAKPSSFI